jgi:hypothetical protein
VHAVSKTHVCPELHCSCACVSRSGSGRWSPTSSRKRVASVSARRQRCAPLPQSREVPFKAILLSHVNWCACFLCGVCTTRGVGCGVLHFHRVFFVTVPVSHTDPFCTCHLAAPHSSLPWTLPSLTPTSHTRRGSRGRFTRTLRCHLHPTSHRFTRPRRFTTQS